VERVLDQKAALLSAVCHKLRSSECKHPVCRHGVATRWKQHADDSHLQEMPQAALP